MKLVGGTGRQKKTPVQNKALEGRRSRDPDGVIAPTRQRYGPLYPRVIAAALVDAHGSLPSGLTRRGAEGPQVTVAVIDLGPGRSQ